MSPRKSPATNFVLSRGFGESADENQPKKTPSFRRNRLTETLLGVLMLSHASMGQAMLATHPQEAATSRRHRGGLIQARLSTLQPEHAWLGGHQPGAIASVSVLGLGTPTLGQSGLAELGGLDDIDRVVNLVWVRSALSLDDAVLGLVHASDSSGVELADVLDARGLESRLVPGDPSSVFQFNDIRLEQGNSYSGTTQIDKGSKLSLADTGSIPNSTVVDDGTLDVSTMPMGALVGGLQGGKSGKVHLGSKELQLTWSCRPAMC